jgi:hypothetical protein
VPVYKIIALSDKVLYSLIRTKSAVEEEICTYTL